jgi:hypothetical protein
MVSQDVIIEALSGLQEPEQPVDGDCLRFESLVAQRLNEAGLEARSVVVLGWVRAGVVAFAHRVTLCDKFVVDFTARQFHPAAPRRWIAPASTYRARLAAYTGISKVTFLGQQ